MECLETCKVREYGEVIAPEYLPGTQEHSAVVIRYIQSYDIVLLLYHRLLSILWLIERTPVTQVSVQKLT